MEGSKFYQLLLRHKFDYLWRGAENSRQWLVGVGDTLRRESRRSCSVETSAVGRERRPACLISTTIIELGTMSHFSDYRTNQELGFAK